MKAVVTRVTKEPAFLSEFLNDFYKYGHVGTIVFAIGDIKTPLTMRETLADLSARYGIKISYLGVEEQSEFLTSAQDYLRFLPWNCAERLNIGILKAYFAGAEVIHLLNESLALHTPNYLGSDKISNLLKPVRASRSLNGWVNPGSFSIESAAKEFYSRGYPLQQRFLDSHIEKDIVISDHAHGKVLVNFGLGVGIPDVDAITALALAPCADSSIPGTIYLSVGTKSPFSCKNTALHRSLIPAYCIPAGLGNQGDIVASYILKRIMDHLEDIVSFGVPLLEDRKTPQATWFNVDEEKTGLELMDKIVQALYKAPLSGITYHECIQELVPKFYAIIMADPELTEDQRIFIEVIRVNYEQWNKALNDITG